MSGSKGLPRFICIEGLDGVGKTQVAKCLSEKLSYQYYRSPGGNFDKARVMVDDGSLDPLTRYFFFRAASQYDSGMIADILETSGVVCDRYIFSTLAYHSAMDTRVSSLFETTGLLMPDCVILLVADEEARRHRLQIRPHVTKIETDFALQLKIDAIYRSLVGEVVDTTHTTIEQATEIALKIIAR